MEQVLVPIVVAVIMAGPTWVSLRRLRDENTAQHAEGRACVAALEGKVDLVHGDVKEVRDKLVEHVEDKEAHGGRAVA